MSAATAAVQRDDGLRASRQTRERVDRRSLPNRAGQACKIGVSLPRPCGSNKYRSGYLKDYPFGTRAGSSITRLLIAEQFGLGGGQDLTGAAASDARHAPRGDNARIAPSTLRRCAPFEAPRDESIGIDGL